MSVTNQSYPNINGGGFVSTGPKLKKKSSLPNHIESSHVFNDKY